MLKAASKFFWRYQDSARRAKTGEIAMVFSYQRRLLEIIRAMTTINPLFGQKGVQRDSQPENLEESEVSFICSNWKQSASVWNLQMLKELPLSN